jgi:hypothetical protein
MRSINGAALVAYMGAGLSALILDAELMLKLTTALAHQPVYFPFYRLDCYVVHSSLLNLYFNQPIKVMRP